ncbi:MAG: aldehyde ferredoxin oxidoreductase family protein, partial [Candidatus Tectimicrobiota bacterium]
MARKYVGGRGMGVKFVFDNGPQVEPLSPDNILCVMVGPLTGTRVRMSGRAVIVTKSPLTGTVTDSHHGGWSGARLKWAGFDGLIFKGKAQKPTYAYIEDGKVTLEDASEVWGKGVHDTVKYMQEKYGEDDLSVMAIGPAGENLVRFACILNEDDRASGRGGTGAVAGSKNLKCIVIKGDRKNMPEPADPEALEKANKAALEHIKDPAMTTAPRVGGLSVHGTEVLMNMVNEVGGLPARNAQRSDFPQADDISGEAIKDTILVKTPTCHACSVACKREVEITEGKHKGLHMESVEYESAWAFGANCDNNDLNAIAAMIDRCNDFGLDTIETGDALAMAMEATQKGLVDGLEWGDTDAMMELIRKIAFREGLGDDLAEGMDPCSKKWGDPSIAMTVKGQSIPAYDPRGIKGMGIGYATSNRGACHLRGYTPASEVVGNVLGAETSTDPLAWEGKGEMIMIFQNVYGFTDSLDVCKFGTFAIPLDVYAGLYSGVTGVPLDVGGLLKIGERVYNLERYYNNINGFREGSDYLPKRFLEEPGTGPAAGSVCELDQMLEEYYKLRGWENGVVPESKLI